MYYKKARLGFNSFPKLDPVRLSNIDKIQPLFLRSVKKTVEQQLKKTFDERPTPSPISLTLKKKKKEQTHLSLENFNGVHIKLRRPIKTKFCRLLIYEYFFWEGLTTPPLWLTMKQMKQMEQLKQVEQMEQMK